MHWLLAKREVRSEIWRCVTLRHFARSKDRPLWLFKCPFILPSSGELQIHSLHVEWLTPRGVTDTPLQNIIKHPTTSMTTGNKRDNESASNVSAGASLSADDGTALCHLLSYYVSKRDANGFLMLIILWCFRCEICFVCYKATVLFCVLVAWNADVHYCRPPLIDISAIWCNTRVRNPH